MNHAFANVRIISDPKYVEGGAAVSSTWATAPVARAKGDIATAIIVSNAPAKGSDGRSYVTRRYIAHALAGALSLAYRLSDMVRRGALLVRIRTRVARVFAVFSLAIILTGCNDVGKQKSLAMAAAKRFQGLYNTGSCQQLYDDASQYFRTHETRRRWLQDCAELRGRLGAWSGFTPASSVTWPIGHVGIVWVRGSAQFLKGLGEVRLDWDLTNDRPALNNVLIWAGGDEISIPGFTGEIRD